MHSLGAGLGAPLPIKSGLPADTDVYEWDDWGGYARVGRARDLSAELVCGECADWVNRLDEFLAAGVAVLVDGSDDVELQLDGQAALALWCVKTGILLESFHFPETWRIPRWHLYRLGQRGLPPPFSQVKIFATDPARQRIILRRQRVDAFEGAEQLGWRFYRTALAVGGFGYEVVGGVPPSSAARVGWAPEFEKSLTPIWPPWCSRLEFPGVASLTADGAERFVLSHVGRGPELESWPPSE